jgi:hypothetical protein
VRKWVDTEWYRYLWHRRLSPEARGLIVLALVLLVLGGGYVAATGLASAAGSTSSAADPYILQTTTVTRVVTVHKNGKAIVKRVPLVQTVRIKAKALTVRDVQTVTTPEGVKTVPVVKLRYVPVTKTVDRIVKHVVTNVVTKNGKTRTVVTSRAVTVPVTVLQTQTQTQTRVVTNDQTVTNEHTDTVVASRPVTTTVVSPPQTTTIVRTDETTTTVVVTQTQTETLPPDTTTVVVTQTETVIGISGL